ncbi:MAG: hypothetical protein MJY64_02415 [archaeon]|nr:hypothetical protein [archaeon]
MQSYAISQNEIKELKQTMGFRINSRIWAQFVDSHVSGCTNLDVIEFVKKHMNPPYEIALDKLDAYLEDILDLFVKFVRHDDV